nr:growth/differentiation factor 11-like [Lytechinus pictus]
MEQHSASKKGGTILVFLTVIALPHVGAAPRPIISSCPGCGGTHRQESRLTSKRNTLSSLSTLPSSASASSSVSYSSATAPLLTTAPSPPLASSVDGEEPGTNYPTQSQARWRAEQIKLVQDEILRKLDMVRPPTLEEIARVNMSDARMQEMYQRYYESVQEASSIRHLSPAYREEIHSFRSTDGPPTNISFFDWFSPRKLRIYLPVQFPQDTPRTVHNATLYLFITPPGITGEETTAVVRIYQLLSPTRIGVNTPRRFVTSKEVSLTDSNWVSFPISEAVSMWVSDPTTNHGLEVECDLVLTTHLFVSGYTNGRVPAERTDQEDLRPRVDITLRQGVHVPHRRRRRSHRHNEMVDAEPECGQYQQSEECCKRRNLTISFRELGFNWILAPLEYNAHFCGGECTELFNMADTHALIRALIRIESPRSLPRPCCTPSKLGSLPVLYLHQLDGDKTEARLYALPDMVVDSCGCS